MSVETRFIASHTKGGTIAHFVRRIIHVSMLAIPFFYYNFLIPRTSLKILQLIILALIFFVFLFEKLRIRMRLVLFAQRLHEATHISAFAWTMLAMGLLLLLSPSESMSIPIVATCALIDPLLGEMRLQHMHTKIIIAAGIFSAWMVWILCAWVYHFPLWLGIVIAPITVAVEWPTFKWIDDNALMLLVPLFVVLII